MSWGSNCSVTYKPARLRAWRQGERQCPDCERRETALPAVEAHSAGIPANEPVIGILRTRPTISIHCCAYTCINRVDSQQELNVLAFNRARWARLSQTQIAIAITIYAFSRFLRLTGWFFGRRKYLCLQTKGSEVGGITSSKAAKLVTYRMPIYASEG